MAVISPAGARARTLATTLGIPVALAIGAAACGEDLVVVSPVIDSPPDGSPAAAFPGLDSIELSVAFAGDPDPLVTATFRRGDTLELPGVPYGENLVIHMIGRVGGSEVAAGRTCPFAVRTTEAPPSPHLYFARTVKWAESGTPASPQRNSGIAITHRDGSGLFVGGLDNAANPVTGVDRFDTTNGKFEELATVLTRRGGSSAALGDGRIVIGGGINPVTAQSVSELEVITVGPNQVPDRVGAGPLLGQSSPVFATLSDGRVVAFGGRDTANTPIGNLVEIAAEGSGITLRVLSRATLATPRYGHTATRLSDDLGAPVLIVGGLDATGTPVATAELYKPLLEELAPPAQFSPAMVVPRRDHQAVRLPDGSVLVIGGLDAANMPVRTLELFSLDTGFVAVGAIPNSAGITDFSVTPLPDGRVLLAGGRDATNTPVNTAFIARLDPIGGDIDVVTTDRLSITRAGHQATLLCDGTVMLVGGTPIAAPAERYNPPATGRR